MRTPLRCRSRDSKKAIFIHPTSELVSLCLLRVLLSVCVELTSFSCQNIHSSVTWYTSWFLMQSCLGLALRYWGSSCSSLNTLGSNTVHLCFCLCFYLCTAVAKCCLVCGRMVDAHTYLLVAHGFNMVAGNNISLGIFNLTSRTIYVGMNEFVVHTLQSPTDVACDFRSFSSLIRVCFPRPHF